MITKADNILCPGKLKSKNTNQRIDNNHKSVLKMTGNMMMQDCNVIVSPTRTSFPFTIESNKTV